jgi:hypothetical protein
MKNSIRLIGARTDLELEIEWRYSFLSPGVVVAPMVDTVFVDVGGRLAPGVIDHHQGISSSLSSARLVIDHPELIHGHLVGPWIEANRLQPAKGKKWSPSVVTHLKPDFDAIVSTFLIEKLIADGVFPDGCRELVNYADRVDSGSERPELPNQCFDLYPLILMLQNAAESQLSELASRVLKISMDEEPNLRQLKVGMHLVEKWLSPPYRQNALREDALAIVLAKFLNEDVERFVKANDRYQHLGKIELPTNSNETCTLETSRLIWCQCVTPSCSCVAEPIACDKIYMRLGISGKTEPTPLTIIEKPRPSQQFETPAIRKHRWIISIDPNSAEDPENARGIASLEGLGASLEWAEQEKRKYLGVELNARRGRARFPEFPEIRDPWYDGRSHGYSIVDSPADGTVLTLAEVTEIIKTRFWEPLHESAEVWSVNSCDGAWQKLTLPQPSSKERRLGDFLKSCPPVTDSPPYLIAVVKLRTGWSEERTKEAYRGFVSGNPESVALSCGTALVSPKSTLVVLSQANEPYQPTKSLGNLLSLHFTLDQIEVDAHKLSDGDCDQKGEPNVRDLRTSFIKAVSLYHSPLQNREENFDDRAIRDCLEEMLQINQRRDSTGDLLQLLDNGEQERSQWSLNRLGVVIAFIGTIQTIVAVFEAIEPTWNDWLGVSQPLFRAVWAVASFVLTMLSAIFLISLPSKRAQRFFAKLPYLKRLFPDQTARSKT